MSAEYRVEGLNNTHDRTSFRSGVSELDDYFHRQAGQDARKKVAAPFVLLDRTGVIAGYYTLSAFSVQLADLPEGVARRLPRYPRLPATMLGRLAVSGGHRGQGLGRLLLMDALYRSWINTSQVASVGVVVDALDDTARAFYLHHEFIPMQDHANRLFLAMGTIEKLFRETRV